VAAAAAAVFTEMLPEAVELVVVALAGMALELVELAEAQIQVAAVAVLQGFPDRVVLALLLFGMQIVIRQQQLQQDHLQ
jgi:ABC-type arginine transport system permease subunit